MIKNTDLGNLYGRMEVNILDNGKMGSKMDLELL